MNESRIAQDTGRVLAVAVLFFGGLAALAWVEGVFDRLGDTAWWLGGFALLAAVAAVWLDPTLRPARRRALSSAPAASPARKPAAT